MGDFCHGHNTPDHRDDLRVQIRLRRFRSVDGIRKRGEKFRKKLNDGIWREINVHSEIIENRDIRAEINWASVDKVCQLRLQERFEDR